MFSGFTRLLRWFRLAAGGVGMLGRLDLLLTMI